ncbi:phosphoglycolate phosphatase [Thiotrichales bacterium HSG1]|nr:phosphoglycolate phosphatase [Thiotrichales bacterium HSG1]
MSLNIPELVLVDLDGTMIDTAADLAYATDGMLSKLNLPQQGEVKVRTWVGNGVKTLVARALEGKMNPNPEPELLEQALDIFDILYSSVNGDYSQPYAGVVEGLEWVKSQNINLACITNKAEKFTLPLLKAKELEKYFSFVISGDSLPKKKPDPMPLLHAAKHFNVDPKKSLMIGDSTNDVQAARAAGFQILCVTYGYNHGQDIRLANPDAILDSLEQISELF